MFMYYVYTVRLQGVYNDILQIVHMPDTDGAQESAPTIPSYAVPDEDKKKDKKVCTKYYVYICMYILR